MDPLDAVSRSMQVLREHMAANLKTQGTPVPAPAVPRAGAQGSAPLRAAVGRRLKALDEADPRYSEHITQVFVESVLLAEFGESLTNDPNFRRLLADVGREMRRDEALARSMERLARELRAA